MGKKKKDRNRNDAGSRLLYGIMYGSCYVFGLLPHWFLYYVVAQGVYFLLYRVARYRVGVVRGNLARSFPEKNKKELRRIERRFYGNLAEYFIDAIDLAGISEKSLRERCRVTGLDQLNEAVKDRNWITMLGHFGSWELMNAYALHPGSAVLVSAYRPLKSKAADMYYKKIRHRFAKLRSVPMNELLRYYVTHQDGIGGYPVNVALIADQNAPIDAQSQWIRFLNQPTVFFHGGEKIARKFRLPVYFMHTRKLRRGYYELAFEMIWDGESPTQDHEITNRFAEMLEADIRKCPELWMWSHRRWKWKPHGEKLLEYNERWGDAGPAPVKA